MLLGKRKNNQALSYIEPFPKRLKFSIPILDYILELKYNNNNNKFVSELSKLSINNETINPYYLDFY